MPETTDNGMVLQLEGLARCKQFLAVTNYRVTKHFTRPRNFIGSVVQPKQWKRDIWMFKKWGGVVGGMDWIHMAQDKDVMNLRVPENAGKLLD